METPRIGLLGGSGLCKIPELQIEDVRVVATPYGLPSAPVVLGRLGECPVAFIPRHGSEHTILPHKVPYKANLAAFKELGIRHVIATCVAGSLQRAVTPGMFVVPDQFINLTWGRDDTAAVDHRVIHLPMANPYCQHLRSRLCDSLYDLQWMHRPNGTVVVIQGPRFSTIAESQLYAQWGGHIVNMTQYPECYFARELGLCYAVLASVTDFDVGVTSDLAMAQSNMDQILAIFHANTQRTIEALLFVLAHCDLLLQCNCAAKQIAPYYEQTRTP